VRDIGRQNLEGEPITECLGRRRCLGGSGDQPFLDRRDAAGGEEAFGLVFTDAAAGR
jgi:hypothetical protein